MGGEISAQELQKKLNIEETAKVMHNAFHSGVSVGQDEARQQLEPKIEEWKADEKKTMSHKLLIDRMLEELSELAKSWKLKTIPWEEAKKQLESDANKLAEGGC